MPHSSETPSGVMLSDSSPSGRISSFTPSRPSCSMRTIFVPGRTVSLEGYFSPLQPRNTLPQYSSVPSASPSYHLEVSMLDSSISLSDAGKVKCSMFAQS